MTASGKIYSVGGHQSASFSATWSKRTRLARDTGDERAHIHGEPVEESPIPREPTLSLSPQPGVFRVGLLENRDVGVGVLPEREESIVRTFGLGIVSRKSVHPPEL
jgi:hypothetical protein